MIRFRMPLVALATTMAVVSFTPTTNASAVVVEAPQTNMIVVASPVTSTHNNIITSTDSHGFPLMRPDQNGGGTSCQTLNPYGVLCGNLAENSSRKVWPSGALQLGASRPRSASVQLRLDFCEGTTGRCTRTIGAKVWDISTMYNGSRCTTIMRGSTTSDAFCHIDWANWTVVAGRAYTLRVRLTVNGVYWDRWVPTLYG